MWLKTEGKGFFRLKYHETELTDKWVFEYFEKKLKQTKEKKMNRNRSNYLLLENKSNTNHKLYCRNDDKKCTMLAHITAWQLIHWLGTNMAATRKFLNAVPLFSTEVMCA